MKEEVIKLGRKLPECSYCGAPATTKDHIPPQGLFKDTKITKKNLFTVPACKACNNGASQKDKIFRLLLVTMAGEHSEHALDVWSGPIARSVVQGDKPLLSDVHQQMRLVDSFSPSGIYLGKTTEIKLRDEYWDTLYEVANRVGRGLYWKLYGKRPPDNYDVRTKPIYKDQMADLVAVLNVVLPEEIADIFCYAYNGTEDGAALILTSYYGKITFGTFIAPRGVLVDNPNPQKTTLDLRR